MKNIYLILLDIAGIVFCLLAATTWWGGDKELGSHYTFLSLTLVAVALIVVFSIKKMIAGGSVVVPVISLLISAALLVGIFPWIWSLTR